MLVLIVSSWFVVFPFGEEEHFAVGIFALLFLVSLFGGFIFVFLPCISGVMCFAKRTVDGEKPKFISVFEPFRCKGKKRYRSFVLLPIALALRAAIIFLPFAGGILNLPFFYTSAAQMSFLEILADSAFILALTALATVVGIYISSYFFFVPYLVVSGKARFFASFSMSVKMARTRKSEITKQTISQIPNVLLSVLSFMVLWVFYAAPRMLVSYFVYCDSVATFDNE